MALCIPYFLASTASSRSDIRHAFGCDHEISVEELIVRENTALHLRSIGELDLRRQTGISVLVMFRDDKPLFPPPLNEKLRAGDRILVMASAEQLGEFQGWLEPDMT